MWSSLLELVNVTLFSGPGVSLYTLAYDTLRGAVTVPRLAIKGPKVGGGPVPGNFQPFPKTVRKIFPLITL